MDANTIFKEILAVVENSSLNHSIYKTPFSATISLRSSFVKYFSDSQCAHEVKNINRKEIKTEESSILKNENIELKAQIERLDNIVKEQKLVIAEKSKKELIEKETRDSKAAKVETKLLKLKSENDQLEEKVKLAQSDCKKHKNEKDQVAKNLKLCEKASEGTDNDLKNVNIEKIAVDKKLDKIVKEMENLKKKQLIEELKCNVCAISYKSTVSLTQHIREKHQRDQVSQTKKAVANFATQTSDNATEDNSEYPCYYCDYAIKSFEDLMNHKGDCPLLDLDQDKCDQCGGNFENRTDLIDHFRNIHPEKSIVWCDFCQAGFETIEELQCHIRIEHRNYLPG